MSARSPLPADVAAPWTAEIEWRADRFCVVARRGGHTAAEVLAESAPVAWPPTDSTDVQALTDAQKELEAALVAAGWEPLSPGGAWYAARFAWSPAAPAVEPSPWPSPEPPEPPGDHAGPFAPVPAWPGDTRQRWRCEITWDAGWRESRFRVVTYRPRGRRGRAIGTSCPVPGRLMAPPDPRRAEHRVAVDALASALKSAGWERVGQGAAWYAERFRWPAG